MSDDDQQAFISPGPDSTGADLYRAGLACSTGQGAPLSYVEAHKWFNLAALAGVQEAKVYRRELSELMSAAEIAAAQEGARAWMTAAVRGGRPIAKPAAEKKVVATQATEAAPAQPKRAAAKRTRPRARVAA